MINFHDWPEAGARQYPQVYAKLLRDVKPEREANNRKVYRDYWWQYAEKRPAMLKALAGLDRVIVITPHPGTVRAEIPIRLPRPRDPLSVGFLEYQKQLLRHLGQAAKAEEARETEAITAP